MLMFSSNYQTKSYVLINIFIFRIVLVKLDQKTDLKLDSTYFNKCKNMGFYYDFESDIFGEIIILCISWLIKNNLGWIQPDQGVLSQQQLSAIWLS